MRILKTHSSVKVIDEEAFGPIAILESVKTFDDAIDLVNDSIFGQQAGVFTNNFQMSGLGREGIRYTMEEMTEPRLIVY